ncbi:MAG TPA: NAD-dependent epimerase/dehydratase family protein [Anaeromyxobacteraceae bacterium]|nr:NAD-dependent epimerase/dehydratase family protein [Anaeromyxobacteraceae bacterium]
MRWLLTGATGFIGMNLAERLVARGDEVRALVRDPAGAGELVRLGAELARGDVSRPDTLEPAVEGVDAVVHLAGLVKAVTRDELFDVNAGGTEALASAAAAAGRLRFVLVSSLAAAGPSRPDRPRTEEDPPRPVSQYGESKLAAEEALRGYAGALEAAVVRPPLVYGPRDKEMLPALFRMARTGLIVKAGLGEKRYSVIHVHDLCELVVRAAEGGRRLERQGSAGIYFADSGAPHTWDELGRAALEALGRRGVVVPVPEAVSWVVAGASSAAARFTGRAAILSLDKMMEIREAAWTCSGDRAHRELGFSPRLGLGEGMRTSVAWFRARGLV